MQPLKPPTIQTVFAFNVYLPVHQCWCYYNPRVWSEPTTVNQIIFGWFRFLIVHEYMFHDNPILWDAKSQIVTRSLQDPTKDIEKTPRGGQVACLPDRSNCIANFNGTPPKGSCKLHEQRHASPVPSQRQRVKGIEGSENLGFEPGRCFSHLVVRYPLFRKDAGASENQLDSAPRAGIRITHAQDCTSLNYPKPIIRLIRLP